MERRRLGSPSSVVNVATVTINASLEDAREELVRLQRALTFVEATGSRDEGDSTR